VIAAGAWILALALQGAAQGPLTGFDPALEHADAVRAERALRLLAAWESATAEQRETAREILLRLRRSNAPAASAPSLNALHAAWRSLDAPGSDASESDSALTELCASLDLRAVPGFFGAREEGQGELVTVRVARLWPAPVESKVVVHLSWIPAGTLAQGSAGATEARSEPAAPAAFEGAGFDLFVRAPISRPGTWLLALELERSGARARAVPIEVECVAEAGDALGLARDVLEEPGPSRPIAQALLARGLAGARLPVGLAASDLAQLLRERHPARPGVLPRPLELAFSEPKGRERWIWAWMPVEPVQRAVVLLAPQGEPPEAVFAGELGRRWRSTAQSLSALLVSSPLPRLGSEGTDAAVVLARVQALVQGIAADLPIAIVARGDALDALHPALTAGARPCAALIAATPREGEPRLAYGDLRTLILAPGGPESIAELPSGVSWVRGERLLWLDELRLPELAASWLESVVPPARPPDSQQDER
jgi:hypothetical protein